MSKLGCTEAVLPNSRCQTFEPTFRHLIQAADEDTQYRIDEVWTLDAVQHGDSGLVNAQDLGAQCVSPSSIHLYSD